MDGGIFGFLGLIASHRGAVEYDWRTRFHMGLREIGPSMSLAEAARHAEMLATDPASAIAAALNGWDHPITREALVLMDLFDLMHQVNADKNKEPDPHPGRPTRPARPDVTRVGDASGHSRDEVVSILQRLGHKVA